MGKESGLAAGFFLSGYDISGDVVAVRELSGGPRLIEGCTGINKEAAERLGGTLTGAQRITTWFNPSPNQAHKRLSGLPTTDVQGQYWHRTALGRPVHCIVGKQLNYDGNRTEDGSFTHDSDIESNGFGAEWATGLTAGKRTDTGATSGTGVDLASGAFTGTSTFGMQVYIQVFSFVGADATILVQASSDNGGADAFAEPSGGLAYVVPAAPNFTRIQTSRTTNIERYVRVATVTTGGFSSLVFAVAAVRNDTLVNL